MKKSFLFTTLTAVAISSACLVSAAPYQSQNPMYSDIEQGQNRYNEPRQAYRATYNQQGSDGWIGDTNSRVQNFQQTTNATENAQPQNPQEEMTRAAKGTNTQQ